MKFIIILISLVGFTGCVSSMSKLNRRPFADDVKFMAFTNGPYKKAKSIGKVSYRHCGDFLFGFSGDQVTFDQLRTQISEEKNVKYMKNVSALEYAETGFIWGKSCVGYEGEAFQ